MTKSIIKQVEGIINCNLKLTEKEELLKQINYRPSPKAIDMVYKWKSHIYNARKKLKENLHSADLKAHRLSSSHALGAKTYIWKITEECDKYGENDFVVRIEETKKRVVEDFQTAHPNFMYDGPFIRSNRLADQLDKKLGRAYAPFVMEYKRDILPRIEQEKRNIANREKENDDFIDNFGFGKYVRHNWYRHLTGELNYSTSPLSAKKDSRVVMFPYAFRACEDVDEDWEYYSKAWHSAHGPKRTVVGREVLVYKWGNGLIQTVELSKWKPGFMTEVVAQVLGVQQPKVAKELRKFQVSPWVDVKRSVKRDGLQFYNLTMGKYIVGVVAYDEQHDIHYHADTRAEAVAGLKAKVEKMEAERQRVAMEGSVVITAEQAHNRWGFCWPGMTEFAKAVGFDIDGSYTVSQLREAVSRLKDRRIVCKYRRELETAKIINF